MGETTGLAASGGYRRDIDGIRAVAVLAVFAYHFGLVGLPGGFVGVDVFFVISGHLIASILMGDRATGTLSLISFYERRARRILPALLAMLAVSAAFALMMLMPAELAAFGRSLIFASLFFSNINFFREVGYFDGSVWSKPLLHTWSLAIEGQLYLLSPVCFIVGMRFFPKLVAPAVVIAPIVSLAYSMRTVAIGEEGAAFDLLRTRA